MIVTAPNYTAAPPIVHKHPPAAGQGEIMHESKVLLTSPVYETYWKYAAERQSVFFKRLKNANYPWTNDAIIAKYRFTNTYRAADRVSQYLIKNVIYEGEHSAAEVFFRTILFKLFNKIETWELLCKNIGLPDSRNFDAESIANILEQENSAGKPIYSQAYMMPSPKLGHKRKLRNHLELIKLMMRDRLPEKIAQSNSLQEVYSLLNSYPSLGSFLAFQFAIDLNYSEIINFSENDFVVAGPGARDGIRKCFTDTAGLSDESIIQLIKERAASEFEKRGLKFKTLWGRELHLIDCQNIFCEVSKYARLAHPEITGGSCRTRIKQLYRPRYSPLPQWYPDKWGIDTTVAP